MNPAFPNKQREDFENRVIFGPWNHTKFVDVEKIERQKNTKPADERIRHHQIDLAIENIKYMQAKANHEKLVAKCKEHFNELNE